MPDPYVVKSGDTLTKIAKANNTTVAELVKLNKIADANKIYVGQKLIFETEAQEDNTGLVVEHQENDDDEVVNNPEQQNKEEQVTEPSEPYKYKVSTHDTLYEIAQAKYELKVHKDIMSAVNIIRQENGIKSTDTDIPKELALPDKITVNEKEVTLNKDKTVVQYRYNANQAEAAAKAEAEAKAKAEAEAKAKAEAEAKAKAEAQKPTSTSTKLHEHGTMKITSYPQGAKLYEAKNNKGVTRAYVKTDNKGFVTEQAVIVFVDGNTCRYVNHYSNNRPQGCKYEMYDKSKKCWVEVTDKSTRQKIMKEYDKGFVDFLQSPPRSYTPEQMLRDRIKDKVYTR